jgi:hypothetical protein
MSENVYQKRARLISEADRLVEKSRVLYREAAESPKGDVSAVNKARKSVRHLVKSADLYIDAGMNFQAAYSYGTAAEICRCGGDDAGFQSLLLKSNEIDLFWEEEEEEANEQH